MGSGTSSSHSSPRRMSPLRILAAGVSWRLFGSRRAAELLLHGATSDDEQSRMLAGMSLVKGGQRSFDLIEDQLESGQGSASLVQLLPDIDAGRARAVLQKMTQVECGEMAETAKQCVELLDRIDDMEGDDH